MRLPSRHGIGLVLLAALVALAASCKEKEERQAYSQVGTNAETLREAFNADAGEVRLIVLLAPT